LSENSVKVKALSYNAGQVSVDVLTERRGRAALCGC